MTDPKTRRMEAAGQDESEAGASPTNPSVPASEHQPQPVSADMQALIGRQLRAVFDDIAKQPVPDRFLELMRQLEAKSGSGVV